MDKIEVARRQLGTALAMFILDQDAVSVHCLACGGSEIIEGLATVSSTTIFTDHILQQRVDLDLPKLRRLRSQYWNAFKHVLNIDKKSLRQDEMLLAKFSDDKNDAALFVGWSDYGAFVGSLPIAAQVFQVWYFTMYEEQMASDIDMSGFRKYFPGIGSLNRPEQKDRLRTVIHQFENNENLLNQPGTDKRPLIMC